MLVSGHGLLFFNHISVITFSKPSVQIHHKKNDKQATAITRRQRSSLFLGLCFCSTSKQCLCEWPTLLQAFTCALLCLHRSVIMLLKCKSVASLWLLQVMAIIWTKLLLLELKLRHVEHLLLLLKSPQHTKGKVRLSSRWCVGGGRRVTALFLREMWTRKCIFGPITAVEMCVAVFCSYISRKVHLSLSVDCGKGYEQCGTFSITTVWILGRCMSLAFSVYTGVARKAGPKSKT